MKREWAAVVVTTVRGLSPVFAGALLGGWTSWTVAAGIPALLLSVGGRSYLGLAIATLVELFVLYQHGVLAFLTLLGLWLAWLPKPGYHLAAALPLALAGGYAAMVSARVVIWLAAGVMLLAGVVELVAARTGR